MSVLAGGSVGAFAGAQGDLAEAEVVAELDPLGVAGFAVLLARAPLPAFVDEGSVAADDFFGIDRDVALGGV